MTSRIEAWRRTLGFFPGDSPNQGMLKQARERRARARERRRQTAIKMEEKQITVARQRDMKDWIAFQLKRANEHFQKGKVTSEEENYVRKHL